MICLNFLSFAQPQTQCWNTILSTKMLKPGHGLIGDEFIFLLRKHHHHFVATIL